MDLTFPAGSQLGNQHCVTITIIDDVSVEDTETFHLQLSTADADVEFSNLCNRATVAITDTDGEYQSISIDLKCIAHLCCLALILSSCFSVFQ